MRGAIVCVLLWGVSALAGAGEGVPELENLMSMNSVKDSKTAIQSDFQALRPTAIRETATTLGLQTGIRWRQRQINASLETAEAELDRVYDFQPFLMYEHKLLPPVITEASGAFKLKDDALATSSETTYEIRQPARLVTMAPSWRDYLIREYEVNEEINPALRPKTAEEKAIWMDGVKQGWEDGIHQANTQFQDNLNRLTRDLRGAVRFHYLAEQNVVSLPMVSEGNLGIQVNGKMLDVGQKVFRVTEGAKFNEEKTWKAINPSP